MLGEEANWRTQTDWGRHHWQLKQGFQSTLEHSDSCCGCKNLLIHVTNYSKIGIKTVDITRIHFNNYTISEGDFICSKCRSKVNKDIKRKTSQRNIKSELFIETANGTHMKCIICRRADNLKKINSASIAYSYFTAKF